MWLDSFFLKYRTIKSGGVALPQRTATNFVGATVTDDPVNDQTTITVTGGGTVTMGGDISGSSDVAVVHAIQTIPVSETAPTTNQILKYNGTQWAPGADSGGTTPTGTGFTHITAGVQDAASKLVENADVHASAAIAVTKLATSTAYFTLSVNSGGTANAFGLLTNNHVDPAAAIVITKLAPGTAYQFPATNAGGTALAYTLLTNNHVDAAAAIDVTKLATSTAYYTLSVDSTGTQNEFGLLSNPHIADLAGIAFEKIETTWLYDTNSPQISQQTDSTASVTGQVLLIHAQDTDGATSMGGGFRIRSGTGTTSNGFLTLYTGDVTPTEVQNEIAIYAGNGDSGGAIRFGVSLGLKASIDEDGLTTDVITGDLIKFWYAKGIRRNVRYLTGTDSIVTDDDVVSVTLTGNATVTFPSAPSDGDQYTVNARSLGGFTLTLDGGDWDIQAFGVAATWGATTTISSDGSSATYIYNSTQTTWDLI